MGYFGHGKLGVWQSGLGSFTATGEPDVYDCGDNTSAWASYGSDTIEWIELTYKTPVVPTSVSIYQNYNPSQVVEVQLIATNGSKYIAWSGLLGKYRHLSRCNGNHGRKENPGK